MYRNVLMLCGIVLLVGWIGDIGVNAQKKGKGKGKSKRITVTIVNRRLVVVENELKLVKDELAQTKQQLQELQSKVQSLSSGGTSEQVRDKFTDLPPCPGVNGFYYAEAMKSCYHLEPGSVLQNFTEATDTCESLNPKAHLVVINSPVEHEYLKNKWYHERGISSIARFWINLQKVENRNMWKWVTSGRRLLYSHWIPTTSHNDDRYGCAAVYSNEAYYWGDVACWGPHMVTCEIEQ